MELSAQCRSWQFSANHYEALAQGVQGGGVAVDHSAGDRLGLVQFEGGPS
jgi:hypothetical protein